MRNWILYILLVVVLGFLWHYYGNNNNYIRMLISSPTLTLDYFNENSSILFKATFTTFYESVFGLIIATFIAFGLMIFCFYNRGFYNFILPIIISSQVIPLITLAPFFILAFGIGIESKVALAAVISFYPIFLNFATGFNSISTDIIDFLNLYNTKITFRIFKIYFPLSLQNIFTGLKISATLSVIGAIVAEFSGAEIGLGKNLLMSAIRIEPELMMISIFLSTLLGGVLFGSIYFLEKLFGKWYLKK